MSLQQKLINLKLNAALAVKHANGWQRLINLYGEEKATEFYKHLGLNHLETKGFEYEELTLSREPKEHEKIAVKGIATAQESAKEAIGKILLGLRSQLITDGLKRIQKLRPATYHELVLKVPSETAATLKERLIKVYRQGQILVAAELGHAKATNHPLKMHDWALNPPYFCLYCGWIPESKAAEGDDFAELDDLTDLTGSRVVNDVQSRLIASIQRITLAGLTGHELINAVTDDINGGSVAYIDRIATGVANQTLSIGRSDEAQSRSDEWDRVEYSALLDQNVCEPCASQDGQTATNEDELQPAPNPDCLGGDFCRCFLIYVTK